METRKLGGTDLQLTTIGLGTWAMAGGGWKFGWGAQDESAAVAAVLRAVELGINWIDTAPGYWCCHSEEVVGRAIRGMSERPYVFTKCGFVWGEIRELAPGVEFGLDQAVWSADGEHLFVQANTGVRSSFM